jgi:hypothetical protein
MPKSALLVTLFALCSTLGFAQSEGIQHHNFSFGIGAAAPTGSSGDYLGTAPLIALRYGYRINGYFQADTGIQMAFGAARNQNSVVTDVGTVQARDREYMIPLGGRFILPLPFRKIQVSAGGGAAYLHYSETGPSSGYYQVNCYTCTSRGGWGGYGLGSVSYFLDRGHNFRVGTTFQYISASTNGPAVGAVTSGSTSDHWLNATIDLGLSF